MHLVDHEHARTRFVSEQRRWAKTRDKALTKAQKDAAMPHKYGHRERNMLPATCSMQVLFP